MYNIFERLSGLTAVVLVGALCLLGGGARANTFVSYNGKFHFSFPEAWAQVDYTTAEYYLTRGNPENAVDFEAVFSERETFTLFQGQYLILTVDTVGPMSPETVDSVLEDISDEFNRPVKELSSEEFLRGSLVDTIAFDRANNLVGIESDVPGGDAGPRVNLLVMKLYEYGIANYYFYAPKVEFLPSLPTYRAMVMSFSTETIESATADEVRVADLEDDGDSGMPVAIYGGIVVILIAIVASRAKSRAKKK